MSRSRSAIRRPALGLVLLYMLTPPLYAETPAVAARAVSVSDPAQSEGLRVIRFELPADALPAGGVCLRSLYRGEALRWLASPRRCSETPRWYALLHSDRPIVVPFELSAPSLPEPQTLAVRVEPARAAAGAAALLAEWANARNALLEEYRLRYFGPLASGRWAAPAADPLAAQNLFAWWQRIGALRHGATTRLDAAEAGNRQPLGNRADVFSLFSGDAAIQETLQRRLLDAGRAAPEQALTQRLASLSGPQTPSHPFRQLLGDRPGGRLPIAERIPADRWMLFISDPTRALAWLDRLGDSGARLAGLGGGPYLDRALVARYLQRLGLSASLVARLAPLAACAALFGPDLYLQHGAHIAVLIETRPASAPLLDTLFGNGEQRRFGPAHVARRGRWLLLATSADETRRFQTLVDAEGRGSLGRSDEFRYMSEQLAPPDSGLYLYLPDAFIRAMTGPRVKIAQLRRHRARVRLQLVTAAALLYRSEHGRTATLDELLAGRAVDPGWLRDPHGDRITLGADGEARSSLYGSLAAMTPLGDIAIDRISTAEAEGYRAYVDSYTDFWRTTFDPIAVRVAVEATLRIDTLILPLINNSIYDAVRATVGGEPSVLAMPTLTPAPLASLSFRLPKAALEGLDRQLGGDRGARTGRLSASLGEQLHIALFDDDPLLSLGSSDLFGAFSGLFLNTRGGGLNLYGSLLAALLTQPAAVLVELQPQADPQRLLDTLVANTDFGIGRRTLQRYGGDGWVYTFSLEDLVRYHLYVYQRGRYLLISNRPRPLELAPAVAADRANAALAVDFTQIDRLAPTLHLRAAQRQQRAWLRTLGQLLPLRWAASGGVAAAQARYARLFGARPTLPADALWPLPDAERFRAPEPVAAPTLPAYHEIEPARRSVGPFAGLARLRVNFALVDAGVRVGLSLDPDAQR